MALWRLYYHLVWATKERQPLINPDREAELYRYIIAKADSLGCIVHLYLCHLPTAYPPNHLPTAHPPGV